MKITRILPLLALATPVLAACEPSYNVTLMLEKDNSYLFDNGKQEITFHINDANVGEYGVAFAANIDASCVETSNYLAGKSLSFDRVNDTTLKVTFTGDSSYAYGEGEFQPKFTFKFLDKAFSKNGFHDYGSELYLIRSHAEIDSSFTGGAKGSFGFKLSGTSLKNDTIDSASLVCSNITVTEVRVYSKESLSVKYEGKGEGATVKIPGSFFTNNKDLVFPMSEVSLLARFAFTA